MSRGITTEVEIGLVPEPVEMAPIVATAPRSRRLEVRGFYERKYWGELVSGGTFFTASDIERRRPVLILLILHMIADETGIRLECGLRVSSCRILSRRGASTFVPGGCEMSVWVDGVNIGIGKGGPDTVVKPVEIAGVEIYKGPASLTAELGGSDSGCGVVVIWTK